VDGDADAAVEASWWGEWWGAGMAICLERGADLHMALLMPLPLAVSCFSKIQIGLPFWYRLTRVVSDKGLLNGCVCVCVATVLVASDHIAAIPLFQPLVQCNTSHI